MNCTIVYPLSLSRHVLVLQFTVRDCGNSVASRILNAHHG